MFLSSYIFLKLSHITTVQRRYTVCVDNLSCIESASRTHDSDNFFQIRQSRFQEELNSQRLGCSDKDISCDSKRISIIETCTLRGALLEHRFCVRKSKIASLTLRVAFRQEKTNNAPCVEHMLFNKVQVLYFVFFAYIDFI